MHPRCAGSRSGGGWGGFGPFCAALLLAAVGLPWAGAAARSGAGPMRPRSAQPAQPAESVHALDLPTLGWQDAPVTVVLFTHFGCYGAARTLAALRALRRRYPGAIRVRFVFHGLAGKGRTAWAQAAEIAFVAWVQGKFWQWAEVATTQGLRDPRILPEAAVATGLSEAAVRSALRRGTYRSWVARHGRAAARVLGARGRRSCLAAWVNGRLLWSHASRYRLEQAVAAALREVAPLRARAVP